MLVELDFTTELLVALVWNRQGIEVDEGQGVLWSFLSRVWLELLVALDVKQESQDMDSLDLLLHDLGGPREPEAKEPIQGGPD